MKQGKSNENINIISAIRLAFLKFGLPPRQHQVRSIVKIIADLASFEHKDKGKVRNYLIQQAAGSGKSLTIACLALVLYKMKQGVGRRGFDTIIILNDRTYLDEQLFQTIQTFFKSNNVVDVAQSTSTEHLASLLQTNNIRVIITTVQKFVGLKTSNFLKGNRVAIIADEAHRTHGSVSTDKLQLFLNGSINQSVRLTYFCFTCTPTEKTLNMFGHSLSGKMVPFSVFSNEDAVDAGIILNVLTDFKNVSLFDKEEDEDEAIKKKTKYIINHFLKKSSEQSSESYVAKGMLVASGRPEILKYKKEFDLQMEAIANECDKKAFDVVCTFTNFDIDGTNVSEKDVDVNGRYAHINIIEEFLNPKSPAKLIIVAEKLQTGFDAPGLGIMYVDKVLKGANAVQTLGRLSRVATGKKSVSIIDFKNEEKDILAAFDSFSNLAPPEDFDFKQFEDLHLQNSIIKMLVNELSGGSISSENFNFAWETIWNDKGDGKPLGASSESPLLSKYPKSDLLNYRSGTAMDLVHSLEDTNEIEMKKELYLSGTHGDALDEPILTDIDELREQYLAKPVLPTNKGPRFVPRITAQSNSHKPTLIQFSNKPLFLPNMMQSPAKVTTTVIKPPANLIKTPAKILTINETKNKNKKMKTLGMREERDMDDYDDDEEEGDEDDYYQVDTDTNPNKRKLSKLISDKY
jgi:superfamily II DNA or RNA helicase